MMRCIFHQVVPIVVFTYFCFIESIPMGEGNELKLEPAEAIIYAGENVTFICTYPTNVTFYWNFDDVVRPHKIYNGNVKGYFFWSQLILFSVKRMIGEITCSTSEPVEPAEALLIVNGVQIGGACTDELDCITDKATCRSGICSCFRDEVLLKISESGYEVCRKMIYKLYDPCEFNEQCFHLVDNKSVCSKKGVCVCASWAADKHGECVTKSEVAYDKNHELYTVGLVAITCLVVVIVAFSLWITLKRSCINGNIEAQLRSISQRDEQGSEEVTLEIIEDKPPSYDDLLEASDSMCSPPNIKEALAHSVTAKKFLRQSSAPAGQLLCTAIINTQANGHCNAQPDKRTSG